MVGLIIVYLAARLCRLCVYSMLIQLHKLISTIALAVCTSTGMVAACFMLLTIVEIKY